jgi:small GTP-binding protein
MIDSSKNYSPEEAIQILFTNFSKSVEDTQAIIAMDADKDETIAAYLTQNESEEALKHASSSIRNILDRLTKELITGSGPVSFFDTDVNRLIFIKLKNIILSIALKLNGSVDNALPYAYLTAEKVNNIIEGREVELSIPLIKIITNEEEQKNIREHFFELRSSEGHFQFKIVVIGENAVGKTSLILRHAEHRFKENYLPTLGVSITTNSFELPLRKARVNFSTWDFGGQQYFRRVRLSYYAGAQACLIVFDLTNRSSFDSISKWNEELKKLAGDIPTILVGNKNDLVDERAVSEQEITEFVNQNGFTFFETSALTGANVEDIFNLLAYKLVDSEARKVESAQLDSVKDELVSIVKDHGGNLRFGVIRSKPYFDPILQVFLDLDRNPKMESTEFSKSYEFNFNLNLVTFEVTSREYFYKQIELLKDLDGVLGIIDARRISSPDDLAIYTQFLKLLYRGAKENYTGSIGILCEKEKYSEMLAVLDISEVLRNQKKTVFFYNLTDNYMLEIMDNLHMFFESYSLL